MNAEDRKRLERHLSVAYRVAEDADPRTDIVIRLRVDRHGHLCRKSSKVEVVKDVEVVE